MIRFSAQLKEITMKLTVDLIRATKITVLTDDLVAGELEKIAPDQMITVTITTE